MAPSLLWCILSLVILLSYNTISCSADVAEVAASIYVPAEENCSSNCLDSALDTNSSLLLQSGVHVLHSFHLLADLEYLEITGNSSTRSVISCKEKAGLTFLNISNLSIENVEFTGCGFTGDNISKSFKFVYDRLINSYVTLSTVQVGLFVGLCDNISLQNVDIRNTSGIGFLTYNTMGSLVFDSVGIYNNQPSVCITDVGAFGTPDLDLFGASVGGGVVVIYEGFKDPAEENSDFSPQLVVKNSHFTGNTDCGLGGYAELFRSMLPLLNGTFVSSAGGGLSILQTQSGFSVNASISGTAFVENNSRFGSGLHIAIFEETKNSTIIVSNCSFLANGFLFKERHENYSSVHGGGGVAILTDIAKADYILSDSLEEANTSHIISFTECEFVSNFGLVGGALRQYNTHTTGAKFNLTFTGCIIKDNRGIVGAAISILENTGTYNDAHVHLEMINSTVTQNQLVQYNDFDVNGPTTLAGILSFGGTRIILTESVTVTNNDGTALAAKESLITVSNEADVVFSENQGEFGGAMRLTAYSQLLLLDNSSISFLGNSASIKGGALYIDLTAGTIVASTGYQDCFLYFRVVNVFCQTNNSYLSCTDISETGVTITFSNNTAPLASVVYGSTLTCAWSRSIRHMYPTLTVFEIVHNYYSNIFKFDRDPVGIEQVATSAEFLRLTQDPHKHVLAPGEKTNMSLKAIDRFGQLIPNVITSRSEEPSVYSILNDTNFSFLKENTTDNTVYLHLKPSGQEKVTDTTNVTIAVSTFYSTAQFHLNMSLRPCYLGFQYNSFSQICECSQIFQNSGISCDPANSAWLVPDGKWLGPQDNNSLALLTCNEDFCNPGIKQVHPDIDDYSIQCSNGYQRTGLGCGQCLDNYSLPFGSNRCIECSNAYLALIPVFAVVGVLLMLALILLPLRISEGYLNGIIFYVNILTLFTSTIFARQGYWSYFIFFIASILSLDLGFEVCFFEGMNALSRTGLQFVFPIYLFILMGLFILFGRFFKLPSWFGIAIPNTFATLMILCYSKIGTVCFDILSPTFAEVIFENTTIISLRWSRDPSIYYFDWPHAILFILAVVVIIFYLIPFPLLLLFPFLAFRVRYLQKLKPLYDAFWNPFDPDYRWWVGFRLIFRCIPFFITHFIPAPLSLLASGLCLLVLLYFQLILRPFNGSWNVRKCGLNDWLRNELDSFFTANLVFILFGALYFENLETGSMQGSLVFVGLSVLAAYIVMVGIVIHALVKTFWKSCRKRVKSRTVPTTTVSVNQEIGDASLENGDDSTALLAKVKKTVPTYTELREPLLEDADMPTSPEPAYRPIP